MFMVKALGRIISVGLSPLGVVELSILAFWRFSLLVGCAFGFGSLLCWLGWLAAWLCCLLV